MTIDCLTQEDNEKGQSFTELAISMVFILVLLAGIVDFGRALFTYVTVRDAAQEGAIYGSFCPLDPTGIENRVRQSSSFPVNLADTSLVAVQCTNVNFSTSAETACSTSSTVVPGNGVKVRVEYNSFRITMPLIGAMIGTQTIPIQAEVIDPVLTVNCPITTGS